MTHPVSYLHDINYKIQKIKNLLQEETDNKASILVLLPEMSKGIDEAISGFFKHQNKEEQQHQKYFDDVIFEFSPDSDFEGGIHRHLKGMLMDMKDIKNWVDAERRLINKNEEYLHARITLIDYDPEDMPDTENLEEDSED